MKKLFLILIISFIYLYLQAQPVAEWVQRFNLGGNSNDYVSDMVVDGQGNVYLTGHSAGDFLTIKYNTSGAQKWVRTYDGSFHFADEAISIVLDRQLNIYVLGSSKNIYGKSVYATIKYSNDGEQLWVREYIDSDSGGAYPYALTVDDYENVYVTGSRSTASIQSDFGTVKYNTNGVFQWAKFYGGTANVSDIPRSITTDKNGNVFVTGSVSDSVSQYPLTTIKYDSLGNQEWVKKYYGMNNAGGSGWKINIDLQDNIFVAGIGTSGTLTKNEFILIKYDTSGSEKWVRRYHCLTAVVNGNAYLKDMAIDNNNNIYVSGLNDSNQNGWDFTTLKYNNNGDWQWIKRYKKAFNSSDDVNAITIDRFNNIFVTGGTDNNTPWYQFLTVKYSQDGTFNWAANYNNNTPYNFNHNAVKVKTDSSGNVYVTGNSEGNGTGMDIAIIKYSAPSGIQNLSNETPKKCKLFQNYPNPFNPVSKISFSVPKKDFITLKIYDILGREISTLVNEIKTPGNYIVDINGQNLSSGVYFCKMNSGDFSDEREWYLSNNK